MAEPICGHPFSFEESILQRLERIATALEKSEKTQREDFEFRKDQLQTAATEQKELVARLTADLIPGAPSPQLTGAAGTGFEHGGRVLRRR